MLLLFALTLNRLIDRLKAHDLATNIWYLDDGLLAGDLKTLAQVFDILLKEGPSLGLKVNRSKCHLWTPQLFPGPLPTIFREDVQFHGPLEGMRVLGCPVGSPKWTRDWLQTYLQGFRESLDRLRQLASPKAQSQILRSCLGTTKLMFLFRTLTWEDGQWLAQSTALLLKRAWESVLNSPIHDTSWHLACLPIEVGGMGILDPLRAQPIAYVASFLSALQNPA